MHVSQWMYIYIDNDEYGGGGLQQIAATAAVNKISSILYIFIGLA